MVCHFEMVRLLQMPMLKSVFSVIFFSENWLHIVNVIVIYSYRQNGTSDLEYVKSKQPCWMNKFFVLNVLTLIFFR